MTNDPVYSIDPLDVDVEAFDALTGEPRAKAVMTITLSHLIAGGVFSWDRPELDWSAAAYDSEQYARVCSYFIERFRYREISMQPFKIWASYLKRKLVFELMPKYKPLYERFAEGIDPLADENEYKKERRIESAYPETLLSGNSDYITDGQDEEWQRIKEGNLVESTADYIERFRSIDQMLVDELEPLFIGMYTVNMNASW